jgi:hypothetical protein
VNVDAYAIAIAGRVTKKLSKHGDAQLVRRSTRR